MFASLQLMQMRETAQLATRKKPCSSIQLITILEQTECRKIINYRAIELSVSCHQTWNIIWSSILSINFCSDWTRTVNAFVTSTYCSTEIELSICRVNNILNMAAIWYLWPVNTNNYFPGPLAHTAHIDHWLTDWPNQHEQTVKQFAVHLLQNPLKTPKMNCRRDQT